MPWAYNLRWNGMFSSGGLRVGFMLALTRLDIGKPSPGGSLSEWDLVFYGDRPGIECAESPSILPVLYEHFLYMPMIGIALIVVYLSLEWAQKQQHGIPTLLKIFTVIMIVFCAINIHRNLDWRTSIGFYEQLVTYRPDDYRVLNNLGMEYANKGIHDKALATYLKAIALDPQNPVAYHNIAGTYCDTRTHLELALEINFKQSH